MAKKTTTDHVVMHPSKDNAMLCTHCGREQALPVPMSIGMFSAMTKAFTKEHRGCTKTWAPPEPPAQSAHYQQRLRWWLANGKRGISSNTMLQVITGVSALRGAPSHPWDPADFNRCHLLLQVLPELREGFPKLAATSTAWKNLLAHWDELTVMLEENVNTGKDNGMYERMRELYAGQ